MEETKTKEVAKQPVTVKSLFGREDVQQKFAEMLGKKAQGFIVSVLQIVNSNALLKQADPMSIYNSACIAATLDLPLNNNLGFAYIIPYNQKYQDEKGDIILYKTPKGPELAVRLKKETVWLDAHQIATLFGTQRPAIVKHVNNIYQIGELEQKSTRSILEQVAADGKIRKMNLYNLDMIISVGYRVNSKQATQFRIWATNTLKSYLLKGYAINEKQLSSAKEKLQELQSAISFLQEKSKYELLSGQEQEILNLLANYSKTLTLLEQYDKDNLSVSKKGKGRFVLGYGEAQKVISALKKDLIAKKEAGDLFGQEYEDKLQGIIGNLYQTFGGKELYSSLEEKAAHLLYFIIKDHPLIDGNKRTGSFLFVYFLDKNNFLYRESGEKKINDNALTALALLIAISDPKDKEVMIKIITNLLQ